MLEAGDALVRPLDLTSARWQILGPLALSGSPLTAPQIASAMGISRQGAQKQLNLLMKDRLVEQRPNPQHERSPLYVLTAEGSATYAKADHLWTQMAEQLAKGLSLDDLQAAVRVLMHLERRLDD
ncbi:transcriptional regulator SlyA [compost metagenome]